MTLLLPPRVMLRGLALAICTFGSITILYTYFTFPTPRSAIVTNLEPAGGRLDGPTPRILLVSAFFTLSKSKHSTEEYALWLSHSLGPITTDIYFFTTPELAPLVRRLRGPTLPITVNTSFSSPFDIPPLTGRRETYKAMLAQDREKKIHSPELYAVWNAKPYFLEQAVQNARPAREYEYAFWNDAGSFRDTHRYRGWPDPVRVRQFWEAASELSGTPHEDLVFFPMCGMPSLRMRNWKESMGPVDNEFSEGSFFGGPPRSITWWRQTFYAYHDHYLAQQLFVGKDQTLINALFLLFPQRILTVWHGDPSLSSSFIPPALTRPLGGGGALGWCGTEWFYYQFWFSDDDTKNDMRAIWEERGRKEGNLGGWWSDSRRCRVVPVLWMRDVLRKRFGGGWRLPHASLNGLAVDR